MDLFNKIHEAVSTGIQKALIINDGQSDDVSVRFYNKEISNDFKPYEYQMVDLDLPSGLLWCEYNLGAFPSDNPKDWYGNYYAWGETEVKNQYTQTNYKFYDAVRNDFLKYGLNKLKYLELQDDAVYNVLGNSYRIPDKADYQELINNTNHAFIENYKGIQCLNGILLTSCNNFNTLFFPVISPNTYDSRQGYYWMSDLNCNIRPSEKANVFCAGRQPYISADFRWAKHPVRGVSDPNIN